MDRLRPYFQLVRLPNVFTALADIALAALAARAVQDQPLAQHIAGLPALCLASACLYCGGMVWNDFFDVEQDRHERPFRPIPSGRVSRHDRRLFGGLLLAAGVVFAILSALRTPRGRARPPIVIALLLVGGDPRPMTAGSKRTGMGPVAMGTCRFLNVLLGLTVTGLPIERWGWLLALVVGVYIVGVTWFARTEARVSNQAALGAAAAVMLAALLLALPLPALPRRPTPPRNRSRHTPRLCSLTCS